jgi:hypothetical protein
VQPGHVSGPVPCHMQGMAQPIYNVFVHKDGSYGAALTQLGAMIRTASGFAAEADAREWVEQDRLMEPGSMPPRDPHPCVPRAG